MPGPRNTKARKKAQAKKQKRAKSTCSSVDDSTPTPERDIRDPSITTLYNVPELTALHDDKQNASPAPTPPLNGVAVAAQDIALPPDLEKFSVIPDSSAPLIPFHLTDALQSCDYFDEDDDTDVAAPLLKRPFIEDPGTGIRVRDTKEFLESRFAAPPSLDDELCAEFAQEEVLQMLCSVLPEETAMILWYNRSRLKARICPACQRLYRLGDILYDPLGPMEPPEDPQNEARISENRYKEQQISGLCSPVCFILAAFNYPAAIRSTWGRMAEDISDETWELLGAAPAQQTNDMGLGMLLKMTRCHDLGLGQLLFPDLDFEEEGDGVQDEDEGQSDESADPETYGEATGLTTSNDVWHDPVKEIELGLDRVRVRVGGCDDHES